MISIAMTTYNGAKYLGEQIDSILNQTIQDFELVVCDDCSSDGTLNILYSYTANDPRIKIYQNEHNIGFKKNFERAMRLCSGEFVALCDQDDIWSKDHLEVLLNMMNGCALACGNAVIVDQNGDNTGYTLQDQQVLRKIPSDNLSMAYTIVYFRNPFQGASMMMKKDFLEIVLPIPSDVKYHDVWIATLACFSGGIKYSSQIINYYRMHGDNVTGNRKFKLSRSRKLIGKILFAKNAINRDVIMSHMKNRLVNISESERKFLEESQIFFGRMHSVTGRLRNIPFLIKHYSVIYG